MAKGGSLKAALVAQQAGAARKAAQVKAQEAKERKEKSMAGGGLTKKQKAHRALKARYEQGDAKVPGSHKDIDPAKKHIVKARNLTYPFDKTDTILLVGEGDFSYTLSILSAPHRHPPSRVLATAYDDEEVCYSKHPNAQEIVSKIRALGARVEFGVDAGNLAKSKAIGKAKTWSKIVFNFPHAGQSVSLDADLMNPFLIADSRFYSFSGAGIKDQDRNILTNQHLLLSFFRSAEPLLTQGPSRLANLVSRPGSAKKAKAKKSQSDDEDDIPPQAADDIQQGQDDIAEMLVDDAMPQETLDDDIGIDIETYLAQNSKVQDLSATEKPVMEMVEEEEEEDDPKSSLPPRVQGTILVTLKDSVPYTLWNLKQLATKPPASLGAHPLFVALNRNKVMGPQPRYTVCRSFAFDPKLYPGYAHVRTKGSSGGDGKKDGDDVIARGTGGLRTWEFALREKRRGRGSEDEAD